MRVYRDADKKSYAVMRPKQEFYEENKPVTYAEYVVRKRKFNALLSILGRLNKKSVLNSGCGAGMDCEWVAKEGAKSFGLDVSSRLIRLAKRRFRKKRLTGKFVICDMENLPFKTNSFDVVIFYDSLHHSDSIHKSLLESNRVTRDLIGIVEPNKNCLTRKLAEIFFKDSLKEHCDLPTKAQTISYYIREFKDTGFRIKEYLFSNIVPPEVCTSNFKISFSIFSSLIGLLAPILDGLFETLFPYSCSACIVVGEKYH